jgi:hypothetical protein
MSRKKIIQILAIILLLIGLIVLVPRTHWKDKTEIIGFLSVAIGTLGSVLSIFIPTNYSYNFREADFENDNDSYFIVIHAKTHGLGKSATIKVYKLDEGVFSEVGIDSKIDPLGNVRFSSNIKFNGKIIVS